MNLRAMVLYPNDQIPRPINVKDSIQVSYQTSWEYANLTLRCHAPASTGYISYDIPDNPVSSEGVYLTTSLEAMSVDVKTPADCSFRVAQYGNASFHADGSQFTLTSREAAATTFGISATRGPSTVTTSSSVSTATNTPETPDSSDSQSQHLKAITSIAIGVSITVAVIAIIAAVFLWIFCARRKRQRERASATRPISYRKPELDGQTSTAWHSTWNSPDSVRTHDYRGERRFIESNELYGRQISEKDGNRVSVMEINAYSPNLAARMLSSPVSPPAVPATTPMSMHMNRYQRTHVSRGLTYERHELE